MLTVKHIQMFMVSLLQASNRVWNPADTSLRLGQEIQSSMNRTHIPRGFGTLLILGRERRGSRHPISTQSVQVANTSE